jgi:hypothetical protein
VDSQHSTVHYVYILYIYIYIINRIYETQNLLSLWLVSFLVGLRTYQYPCTWLCQTPDMCTSSRFHFGRHEGKVLRNLVILHHKSVRNVVITQTLRDTKTQ